MDKLETAVQSALGTLPMVQIEIIRGDSFQAIEHRTNAWLNQNSNKTIRDVRVTEVKGWYVVTIIYEK